MNAVVNVGVKPLLNAPVNAGRIVNAEVTFYCPVFFELASARCLIDRSLLIKPLQPVTAAPQRPE